MVSQATRLLPGGQALRAAGMGLGFGRRLARGEGLREAVRGTAQQALSAYGDRLPAQARQAAQSLLGTRAASARRFAAANGGGALQSLRSIAGRLPGARFETGALSRRVGRRISRNLRSALVRQARRGWDTQGLLPDGKRWRIESGDTGWAIAKELTGDGARWKELKAANPEIAKRPDPKNWGLVAYPGEVLALPPSWYKPALSADETAPDEDRPPGEPSLVDWVGDQLQTATGAADQADENEAAEPDIATSTPPDFTPAEPGAEPTPLDQLPEPLRQAAGDLGTVLAGGFGQAPEAEPEAEPGAEPETVPAVVRTPGEVLGDLATTATGAATAAADGAPAAEPEQEPESKPSPAAGLAVLGLGAAAAYALKLF
jgi:hypothetical protein